MSTGAAAGDKVRLTRVARSPGPLWALTILILLLELASPPRVVFGYLYVIPLVIEAPYRNQPQALGFLTL